MGERHVEVINGTRLDLGRMSLAQLVELENQCRLRAVDAQVEYEIVSSTRLKAEQWDNVAEDIYDEDQITH